MADFENLTWLGKTDPVEPSYLAAKVGFVP
jgi:hypothetical protein